MYKQMLDVLSAHEPVWQGVPAFGAAYDLYSDLYDQLNSVVQQYSTSLSGVATLKDEKKDVTALKAKAIAGALRIFAFDNHDVILTGQLDFPNHFFINGSSVATGQKVELVLSLAVTHAAALAANYGISQQDIDELALLHTELKALEGTPRGAIIDRKEMRAEMTELFDTIDTVLKKKLDQLMLARQATHPKFYQKYKDSRKIVDYKGKKNKKGDDELPGNINGSK